MDYRDRYISSLEDQIELLKSTLALQNEKLALLTAGVSSTSPSPVKTVQQKNKVKVEKKVKEKVPRGPYLGPACDGCRVRKRKCDRERPSCSYCRKLKSQNSEAPSCTYPEKGKGVVTPAQTPDEEVDKSEMKETTDDSE